MINVRYSSLPSPNFSEEDIQLVDGGQSEDEPATTETEKQEAVTRHSDKQTLEVQRVHNEQRPIHPDDDKARSSIWKIADFAFLSLFLISVIFLFVGKCFNLEFHTFADFGALQSMLTNVKDSLVFPALFLSAATCILIALFGYFQDHDKMAAVMTRPDIETLEVQRVHNEQRPVHPDDGKSRSSVWKLADFAVYAGFIISLITALFLLIEKFVTLEECLKQVLDFPYFDNLLGEGKNRLIDLLPSAALDTVSEF